MQKSRTALFFPHHVVKEGGAAAAVAKMAFGNKLGFKFEKTAENAELLFAPKAGALVVEVPADALESVKNTFDAVVLGTVTDTAKIAAERQSARLGRSH